MCGAQRHPSSHRSRSVGVHTKPTVCTRDKENERGAVLKENERGTVLRDLPPPHHYSVRRILQQCPTCVPTLIRNGDHVVAGRCDFVCQPQAAYRLAEALKKVSTKAQCPTTPGLLLAREREGGGHWRGASSALLKGEVPHQCPRADSQ